jgi:hypothetical protein
MQRKEGEGISKERYGHAGNLQCSKIIVPGPVWRVPKSLCQHIVFPTARIFHKDPHSLHFIALVIQHYSLATHSPDHCHISSNKTPISTPATHTDGHNVISEGE